MFKIISKRKLSWHTDTITKLHGIIEQLSNTANKQAETIKAYQLTINQQEQIIKRHVEENRRLKQPKIIGTIKVDANQAINEIKELIHKFKTEELIASANIRARDEKGRFKKKEKSSLKSYS